MTPILTACHSVPQYSDPVYLVLELEPSLHLGTKWYSTVRQTYIGGKMGVWRRNYYGGP